MPSPIAISIPMFPSIGIHGGGQHRGVPPPAGGGGGAYNSLLVIASVNVINDMTISFFNAHKYIDIYLITLHVWTTSVSFSIITKYMPDS